MPENVVHPVVIVGGGVSGLLSAWQLVKKNIPVIVVEKRSEKPLRPNRVLLYDATRNELIGIAKEVLKTLQSTREERTIEWVNKVLGELEVNRDDPNQKEIAPQIKDLESLIELNLRLCRKEADIKILRGSTIESIAPDSKTLIIKSLGSEISVSFSLLIGALANKTKAFLRSHTHSKWKQYDVPLSGCVAYFKWHASVYSKPHNPDDLPISFLRLKEEPWYNQYTYTNREKDRENRLGALPEKLQTRLNAILDKPELKKRPKEELKDLSKEERKKIKEHRKKIIAEETKKITEEFKSNLSEQFFHSLIKRNPISSKKELDIQVFKAPKFKITSETSCMMENGAFFVPVGDALFLPYYQFGEGVSAAHFSSLALAQSLDASGKFNPESYHLKILELYGKHIALFYDRQNEEYGKIKSVEKKDGVVAKFAQIILDLTTGIDQARKQGNAEYSQYLGKADQMITKASIALALRYIFLAHPQKKEYYDDCLSVIDEIIKICEEPHEFKKPKNEYPFDFHYDDLKYYLNFSEALRDKVKAKKIKHNPVIAEEEHAAHKEGEVPMETPHAAPLPETEISKEAEPLERLNEDDLSGISTTILEPQDLLPVALTEVQPEESSLAHAQEQAPPSAIDTLNEAATSKEAESIELLSEGALSISDPFLRPAELVPDASRGAKPEGSLKKIDRKINKFPSSYEKIYSRGHPLRSENNEFMHTGLIAIFGDYCGHKAYPLRGHYLEKLDLFFHGHWKRNHVNVVQSLMNEYDPSGNKEGGNICGFLNALKRKLIEVGKEINPKGSLARRIAYVQAKMGKDIIDIDTINDDIKEKNDKPQLR